MKKRANFTKREIETTIKVLRQSRMVTEWVKAQAQLLGVDVSTPEGQEFYERETRAHAQRLIK